MTDQRKMTEVNRQSRSARLGAILLYGTFGLLMFGPLMFGAVESWSIFILEIGAVALTLLWFAKQWIDGEIEIHWNPLFLPMAGFGILIALQLAFRISAYRHDTTSGAMLYCAYGLICFLCTQCLVRGSQARIVGPVLAVYGFAIAAFALVQGLAPNGKIYWLREAHLGGWIYGPYVNHNHYAGLMELLVPIPLVISLTQLAPEKERIAAGIAAAVMVATIFFSGSRGGMLAIFVELSLVAIVFLRQNKGARVALSLVTFAVALIGLLTWLGGKELTSRVSSISTEARTELSGGMRLSIDRDAFHMFEKRPVIGWGLGTFPTVYPQFRTFYTNFFVNEAHNDYLQLLSEMGTAGFAMMLWFLVVLYRQARKKIKKWPTDVSAAMTFACVLGAIGILVHSVFDFNLQIPANAALFYAVCTIAAGPPLLQRVRKRRPVTPDTEQAVPESQVV